MSTPTDTRARRAKSERQPEAAIDKPRPSATFVSKCGATGQVPRNPEPEPTSRTDLRSARTEVPTTALRAERKSASEGTRFVSRWARVVAPSRSHTSQSICNARGLDTKRRVLLGRGKGWRPKKTTSRTNGVQTRSRSQDCLKSYPREVVWPHQGRSMFQSRRPVCAKPCRKINLAMCDSEPGTHLVHAKTNHGYV